MKIWVSLFFSFGALLAFPDWSRAEIAVGEKPGERQIQRREKTGPPVAGLMVVAQDSGQSKPPASIFVMLVEAYAGLGEGIGNLFKIHFPRAKPQQNEQASKLTNHPVSTLSPVLKNLQAVGTD